MTQQARLLGARRLLLVVALLLPPLLARVASLLQQEARPRVYDLIGATSDLGIALLLLAGVALVRGRGARIAAGVVALANGLAVYGNYEHVRALNTSLDVFSLKFLGDATFVRGTMHVSSWPLFLLVFVLPLLLLIPARGLERRARWLIPVAVAAALSLALSSALPPHNDIATWRQYNMVHQNLLGLAKRAFAKSGAEGVLSEEEDAFYPPEGLSDDERAQVDALMRPDLEGEPRVALDRDHTNVLLIMLEAVSGAYLEASARPFNRSAHYDLPRLSALAQQAVVYRSFVAHQRRTNRGEYALLCGDHPNLGLKKSKMDYYALETGAERPCLPAALTEAGYETVYLQSAPLGFMSKDRFMKRAGYDQVLGMAWFERASAWSAWGPDDRTFFQQSLRKVDELRGGDKPWFLTLLTSGTHHPYHVDPAFESEHEPGTLGHAMSYLDLSVAELLEALRERGVFEDTLVLITCDESNGLRQGEDLARILSQNWGLMVAFAPGEAPARVDERFAQTDVALSVLDYLGLDAAASGFAGRSLFRTYATPRYTLFGNVYRNRLGLYRPDGDIVLCTNLLERCRVFHPSGPELVPESLDEGRPAPAADQRLLQQFLARNELSSGGELKQRYELARLGKTEFKSQNARYVVFGYQYLNIPPDTELRVKVEVGVERGQVQLTQDLASGGGRRVHFTTTPLDVSAGQTLEAVYTFHAAERMDKIEVRLFAENRSGAPALFDLRTATLELKPMQRGISGIVEKRVSVTP